jgi:hypothetical protein
MTDNLREADTDNPRGYFEYEPVKELHRKPDLLRDARGKVVKIVTPLLPYVPARFPCRVVFVDRDLDEVLASQGEMLVRRGGAIEDTPARRSRLRQQYALQVQRLKSQLAARPGCHLLVLEHAAVIRNPREAAERLNRFLGGHLDVEAMTDAVQPKLHRQKKVAVAEVASK